jgi:glycerophosphoryl diester phosphodiesterase
VNPAGADPADPAEPQEPLEPAERADPALPQVIAHRGASHDLPEHTEAAYREAIAVGADALECDVRLTADRHLVCVHDRRVDRTSSGSGLVSTKTLAELQALDWGSWKPGGEPAELLTLDALLKLAAGAGRRIELAIETKHPNRYGGQVEERLAERLAAHDWAGPASPVRVMSFSVLALRRMARLTPRLPLVYLMERVPPMYRDGSLPEGVRIAGISVQILREQPDYVRRLVAAGATVHVWTVDDPDDVQRCLDAGVGAIITNRPREVLLGIGRRPGGLMR